MRGVQKISNGGGLEKNLVLESKDSKIKEISLLITLRLLLG